MLTLLADVNIEGHVARLAARMRAGTWQDFWEHLQLRLTSFAEVGLPSESSDNDVWHVCQDQQILLLTSNRNAKGPGSLEAVIREKNSPDRLPVFTLADADRVLTDAAYADRIIDRLFICLLDLDAFRGAGRLFLP